MSSTEVQIDYEEMSKAATEFENRADTVRLQMQRLILRLDAVRSGGWEGANARYFFNSMDNEILPGMSRLYEALNSACETANRITKIFQDAEEEAAFWLSNYDF
jgi:WXG100 family type VII secretion target